MKNAVYLIMPLVMLAAWAGRLEAASLRVGPAGFIIHNVVPGQTYDVYKETGLQLTVKNDNPAANTYQISTHLPSADGEWEKGYQEIPDPKWCQFEQEVLEIGANTNAYARFTLKIPDEERYYNQRWVVTMNVAGKARGGMGVGVAVNIRAQIETKSRANMKGVAPYGPIGVAPSIVNLDATDSATVEIFNNSAAEETYKIYAMTDEKLFQKYNSSGSLLLTKPGLLKLGAKKMTIPAGGRKTLGLQSAMPEDEANFEKKYETIVFIEGKGAANFVRVRIVGKGVKKDLAKRLGN